MFNWLSNRFKKTKIDSKVTSLAEMTQSATPVVPIPSWDGDSEIHVRLRRVTLTALIQSGQLPNELLAFAQELTQKGQVGEPISLSKLESEAFAKYTDLMHAMAKAALAEPTYDQILTEVGWLTDQQLMAIHYYCLGGVRALHSFRKATGFTLADGNDGKNVRSETE
jgi:hypothetical protein